ncbi:helix-turn-helix domain-containing protein [Dictyobacter aurantiacus]|uniref:Uncharacterized protein n=1 Tax=Dictyobacter aurantiacus TaxID=1936993 RepID=A0A401ZFR9_9CHLR|nr:hypothetical protein [Dictyobacter aurantiacus]GCE05740.1 hypothetical protein KDAU_30690 [Dictyobacter aurantiacus]
MTWQGAFRVFIRVIFIFAYIAFLAASIRHVATFFHNFEADPTDWVNPYTLAVSIDLTALVLTVGVMFFRGNMPWYAQTLTWLFIVCLTAFSWFVNWEYAMTFQGNDLRVNDTLRMLNPILASSFAFLNLAYSVVAEFFSSKNETAAELAAKVDELEMLEEQQRRLAAYKQRTKQPGMIERVKNTALEARAAVNEVLTAEPVGARSSAPGEANIEQVAPVTMEPVKSAVELVPTEMEERAAVATPEPQPVAVREAEMVEEIEQVTTAAFNQPQALPSVEEATPREERIEEVTQDNEVGMKEEEEHTTEPLTFEMTPRYKGDGDMGGGQDSGPLAAEAVSANAFLPAWAGGDNSSEFLAEEMASYLPPTDTGSLPALSSNTGKLTRRKPMTVAEAAEALSLSERRVRELRSQGVLVADDTNKIRVASVNAYLGKRRSRS